MKILVTGGSGYLGTHIRKTLEADDLSRRSGSDILYEDDAAAAFDYDMVIHLAAKLDKSDEAADDVFETNVAGTINLLKNIRKDAVFIFASTKDVYGRFADKFAEVPEHCPTTYSGQSALEWSKLVAERYVEFYAHKRNFRSCIFRLSTVYAPPSTGNVPNIVGHFAESINNGEPILLPANGKPVRDILHVDDLSAACTAFADSVIRHGLYNLGGGRANAFSLKALVEKMEEISGLQAVTEAEENAPVPVPLNYVSDITHITQELDWNPQITADKGIATLFAGGG